jgi:uncharacterized protein YybS (DUF2232 family)
MFVAGLSASLVLATNGVIWQDLRRGKTPAACLLRSALTALGVFIIIVVAGGLLSRQNFVYLWQQDFQASLQASIQVYRQLHWEEAELQQAARWATVLFSDALYAWIVVALAGFALFCNLLQRRLAPQLPGSRIPLQFKRWSAPGSFIWLLMAALLLLTLGFRLPGWPRSVGLNMLVALAAGYLVVGTAIMLQLFQQRKVPRHTQILLSLIFAVFPSLMSLLMLLGLSNTWWDWRGLHQIRKEEDVP